VSLAAGALPLLILFALLNLLCSRAVFLLLERWLAQRRTRELLGILFLLFIIGTQFIGPIAGHLKQSQLPGVSTWTSLLTIERASPPGLAAFSLESLQQGQPFATLAAAGGLLIYAALFGLLLLRRLKAQYLGENLSEAMAPAVTRTSPTAVRPGWQLSWLSPPIAAVFEKECRYLLRSGPILFTLIMPLVILIMFRFLPGRGETAVGQAADFAFPAGAGYALLVLTNLAYNLFGAEGAGVQTYWVGPVRLQDVFLAKNLTHAAVLGVDTGLVLLGTFLFFRPPSASIFLATIGALLFALPLNFAAGNLTSVYAPKKIDLATFGRQRASGITALVSVVVVLTVLGTSGAIIAISHLLGRDWLAPLIFLPLAAGAFAVYWALLGRTARLALSRREVLLAEICRG